MLNTQEPSGDQETHLAEEIEQRDPLLLHICHPIIHCPTLEKPRTQSFQICDNRSLRALSLHSHDVVRVALRIRTRKGDDVTMWLGLHLGSGRTGDDVTMWLGLHLGSGRKGEGKGKGKGAGKGAGGSG